jgi:Tfp pilus assembly ATPase PilU
MVAMVKAGVELAFEEMVAVGMKPESAYYESLHETPLIANTIARMKLYEMNSVISDTAEYGCYLYDQACRPVRAANATDTNLLLSRALSCPPRCSLSRLSLSLSRSRSRSLTCVCACVRVCVCSWLVCVRRC